MEAPLPDRFRVLLNCDDTMSMSGRKVGRHALIMPLATSTTHQVQAVARVPVVSVMSKAIIVVKRYILAKRTLQSPLVCGKGRKGEREEIDEGEGILTKHPTKT